MTKLSIFGSVLCESLALLSGSFSFLGPSSKQLLTEKMAAQMYNLRISNDYNHPSKSLPRLEQLLCATRHGSSDSTRDSSHSLSTMEEEQEQERNKQTRFILFLKSKSEQFLHRPPL